MLEVPVTASHNSSSSLGNNPTKPTKKKTITKEEKARQLVSAKLWHENSKRCKENMAPHQNREAEQRLRILSLEAELRKAHELNRENLQAMINFSNAYQTLVSELQQLYMTKKSFLPAELDKEDESVLSSSLSSLAVAIEWVVKLCF
jgi:hypothetical protein